ncbi:MAG: hypothetical protein Altm2KO_35990 [Alteromonas macleodii]
MDDVIIFTKEELIELYEFFDKTNRIFHQPMNYGNEACIAEFASSQYPTIKKFYYETLWDKLPKDYKENILNE